MSDQNINVVAVPVEGLGQFLFKRRAMRQEMAIRVEQARLTEGVSLDEFTELYFEAFATLKVLLVEAPEASGLASHELDGLDPFDDDSYAKVLKVWRALRQKEETFRRARKAVPGDGEGVGGDVRPLVSPDLQPGAD